MYYRPQNGPRFEYREKISQRVNAAPTLASKFPQLKSISIDIGHFSPDSTSPSSQLKFTPNLERAKAMFRIDCPNQGCIGGDFDLTESIANAIASRQTKVSAELCCQGWQNKTTIDTLHCHHKLRYTLNLGYHPATGKASQRAVSQLA